MASSCLSMDAIWNIIYPPGEANNPFCFRKIWIGMCLIHTNHIQWAFIISRVTRSRVSLMASIIVRLFLMSRCFCYWCLRSSLEQCRSWRPSTCMYGCLFVDIALICKPGQCADRQFRESIPHRFQSRNNRGWPRVAVELDHCGMWF
jgi:hypothetical protein